MINLRQGEILIYEIKAKKKFEAYGYTKKAGNVIAEGEISGHLHAVTNGKLYEKDGKIVLEADKGCILTHPEHKSIPIPEGKYEIAIQVEYDEKDHKSKVKD